MSYGGGHNAGEPDLDGGDGFHLRGGYFGIARNGIDDGVRGDRDVALDGFLANGFVGSKRYGGHVVSVSFLVVFGTAMRKG